MTSDDTVSWCFVIVDSYPLLLSIESHCSIKQQQTMAYYMRQVFGNKLSVDPVDMNLRYLPSPEDLRRKILIKVTFTCRVCVLHIRAFSHSLFISAHYTVCKKN